MLCFVIRWISKAQCAKLIHHAFPLPSNQSNKNWTTFVYNIIPNGNILICLSIQHWALNTEHVCRLLYSSSFFFWCVQGCSKSYFSFHSSSLCVVLCCRCRCCRCRCRCCSEHYSNEVVNFKNDKVTSLKWRSSTLTGYYCCSRQKSLPLKRFIITFCMHFIHFFFFFWFLCRFLFHTHSLCCKLQIVSSFRLTFIHIRRFSFSFGIFRYLCSLVCYLYLSTVCQSKELVSFPWLCSAHIVLCNAATINKGQMWKTNRNTREQLRARERGGGQPEKKEHRKSKNRKTN